MRIKKQQILAVAILFFLSFLSQIAFSYPDEEKAQLSITDVSAQAVQMHLTSDNRYLYLGFNDQVKIVDMGKFDLASTQPYDFGDSTDYDGMVGGIALSSSYLYISQDNGNLLSMKLDDLTAEPRSTTISSSISLGKMAINSTGTRLYIVDKTNDNIIVYTIGATTHTTITLTSGSVGDFTVTDMLLVPEAVGGVDYIYITTNKGIMFYFGDGSSAATEVVVAASTKELKAIAVGPTKEYIYVVNSTDKSMLVRTISTLAAYDETVLIINEDAGNTTYNTNLSGVVALRVINPTSTYKFVSGLKGISVLDVNDNLINVGGATTYDYTPIPITGERYGLLISSSDRYIYMSCEGGPIAVITENPYVVISSVAYSGGSSALKTGVTATITFQSDTDGTYEVRAGGNVDESGTLIVNTSGSSGGSVTADTDTTFTFSYDDNSSKLDEGTNTIFIFVTDSSSNVGRDATTVSVDTPPPAVTVNSAAFGNTRLYINMQRLTVSDMSYYNVYVSTDPDAVVNKTVTAHVISQPSSGSTVTAEISGLTNGSLYYASVEAVDTGGNVGPLTTTFPDGSRITGTPEATLGPVELMGETGGCSLVSSVPMGIGGFLLLVAFFAILLMIRKTFRSRIFFLLPVILMVFFVPNDLSAEEASSQWWSTELRGSFWMPTDTLMKRFYEPCCNMMGAIEQGFLYDSKYGVGVGVGFLSEDGTAIGAVSGGLSQDRFNLFLLPCEVNLVFRGDFLENQILVPYVKFGGDFVYFRENLRGNTTNGLKKGIHVDGGIQVLLDFIDQGARRSMEEDFHINDVYLTLGARYSWINNFGGRGLDLSGIILSFGLLFEY